MGDCIETVIEETEKHLTALKEVARVFPRCEARRYDRITVWVVDMPHEECDGFHTWSRNSPDSPPGRVQGYAIIFRNMGQGVNIAPKEHYIPLGMLAHYIRGKETAMKEIVQVFKEHGDV